MAEADSLRIDEARTPEDTAEVAGLMRAFVAWLRVRYRDRLWQVEEYFREPAWSEELAALAERYAAPAGAMLLARLDGRPAGCVAFRTVAPGVCEMKRLFVAPDAHGRGIGRRLCMRLIALARERGFATMRLDAGDLQPEALALYRALGFAEIPCWWDCPEPLRSHLVFMEREI